MEKKLIELIESLNRIMSTWNKLILRRTILNLFTILLFAQVIVTFIFWIFGRDACNTWLGILTVEFGAWGTMLAFYFNERGKDDRHE